MYWDGVCGHRILRCLKKGSEQSNRLKKNKIIRENKVFVRRKAVMLLKGGLGQVIGNLGLDRRIGAEL